MKEQTPTEFLNELYNNAMSLVGANNKIISDIKADEQDLLDLVLQYSEQAKACLAVVFTSLTYKHFNPKQDIRNHRPLSMKRKIPG